MDGLGELPRLGEIRLARLHPDQVAMRAHRPMGAGDAGLDAVPDIVEALDGTTGIIVDEGLVALVDVGGKQLRGLGVGGGRRFRVAVPITSAASRAASRLRIVGRGRDQHLAAQMTALFFRRQLVLEMDARCTRLDEGPFTLIFERIERGRQSRPRRSGNDRRRKPGLDRQALAFGDLDSGRRAAACG